MHEEDELGMKLCEMFLNNEAKNPLQPTGPLPEHEIRSFSEFVERFKKYVPVLLGMVEVLVSGKEGQRIIDLKKRAEKIKTCLLSRKYKTFRLMDGHGRIIFLVCIALLEEDKDFLDSLQIEIFDLNENVVNYHKSLFKNFQNVKVFHKNIFDMPTSADTFVYLNFCGMASSFKNVKLFSKKCAEQRRIFLLSFSVARNAKIKNYLLSLNKTVENLGNFKFEKLHTPRKDFQTLIFVLNQ